MESTIGSENSIHGKNLLRGMRGTPVLLKIGPKTTFFWADELRHLDEGHLEGEGGKYVSDCGYRMQYYMSGFCLRGTDGHQDE